MILVTGTRGFIGSHLTAYLQEKGYNVVGIDKDIRDKEALRPYFKKAEKVIHAAAKTKNAKTQEDYYTVNVLGTKNVAELCLENDAKLIHLSSIATEGAYGASKQESQRLVEEYTNSKGLKAIILRLCVIYDKQNDTGRRGARYPVDKLVEDIERIIKTYDFGGYQLVDYAEREIRRERHMKNLLVYISPNKQFNPEHELMAQVQIENSLEYWWKEDIILLTNFPYKYGGVKAIVAGDNLINKAYFTNPRGIINSKINAIIYLLENKIINELTWFHDFDSFQLAPLNLPPIKGDMGVVCYGIYPESRLIPLKGSYKYRLNFGNVFFKPASLDIFKMLLDRMDRDGLYEEDAMTLMLGENNHNIASRVQIMNQTYNIGMRCVRSNIAIADRPIRVAHFPPNNLAVLHKFSRILPPKLFGLLEDRFKTREEIKDLRELQFSHERRIWKPFMEKYNCQRIAEVGVYKGDNFRRMIEHKPEAAVAVDAWLNDGVASRNDCGHTQEEFNQMYDIFRTEMTDKPFVNILRGYSFDTANYFPDEYFDLIYIDADHTYEGCLADLEAWYPKIRKGGFLIGDDYSEYTAPKTQVIFGVIEAVDDFAKKSGLRVYELPSCGWVIIK